MRKCGVLMGIFLVWLVNSCIGEDYPECPDFGKYRVIFSGGDSLKIKDKLYMSLIYGDEKNTNILNGYRSYIKESNKPDFTCDRVLKLLPGDYRFCSIACTSPLIVENGMCKMSNRELYLFEDRVGRVLKRYENRLILNYYPVNATILAECILDRELSGEYEIKDFAISAPDDSNVFIDHENGLASYSESVTDFFDHFQLNSEGTLFQYYCVPFRGGCYVNFRITLALKGFNSFTGKDTTMVLRNHLYLKSDIEQGKIYKFTFEVSALEINWKSTTVSDWDEYESDGEIPVI